MDSKKIHGKPWRIPLFLFFSLSDFIWQKVSSLQTCWTKSVPKISSKKSYSFIVLCLPLTHPSTSCSVYFLSFCLLFCRKWDLTEILHSGSNRFIGIYLFPQQMGRGRVLLYIDKKLLHGVRPKTCLALYPTLWWGCLLKSWRYGPNTVSLSGSSKQLSGSTWTGFKL